MSPAGHWPQLKAAIEAGADAVYFGLQHFSARAKVGFTLRELPEVMKTLHGRGVKGYVTFNTLVFDEELEEAARVLGEIATAGADSIIVQDIGMVKLAKKIAPQLAIHGSTQMSITSAEGIAMAMEHGVSRVVMARELSLENIRVIREQSDCELEMFVHGALCVSYSGQCFSSEAWGGRSANRGQCAQACRLPYELLVDDVLKPLGEARYLLSPGDLYALHQVPEIIQIGIASLKIEGRYKDADYVALTTRAYRKAVDEAWAEQPLSVTRREDLQLEQVYSRGLHPHFLTGTNHQTVVEGRAPRHRGILMGRVTWAGETSCTIVPGAANQEAPLKAGDGLVFDAADWANPHDKEEGGNVYKVTTLAGGEQELEFANGAINFKRVRAGDLLWRTHDHDLDKLVKPYLDPASPNWRQSVQVKVTARAGERLETVWTLVNQPEISVTVCSEEQLERAQNRALETDLLQEQLGRLGNTAYQLAAMEVEIAGAPFAPSSLLNQMRREAVERLALMQVQLPEIRVMNPASALAAIKRVRGRSRPVKAPRLHLLVRTQEQLTAAISERPASITLDYLELYGLRPSVELIKANGIEARVASPRVLKPSEERIVHFLLKLNCPVLVRSAGLLNNLQTREHPMLIGDFSLNAANAISMDMLMQLGLTYLTPSQDLNARQIVELAAKTDPQTLEVIAYQHLPVFHTEHCVFCRFMSTGTTFEDCGHPCEKHRVALRDDNGRAHPVMADVGCRNTVFGAEAQEASQHMGAFLSAGINNYRLEFVHETPVQVRQVAKSFADVLAGNVTWQELGQLLKQFSPQGTTQGSLFVPKGKELLTILQ